MPYTVTLEAPDPSGWHFSITTPSQKTRVHVEQKGLNDTPGTEGGKKVAGQQQLQIPKTSSYVLEDSLALQK